MISSEQTAKISAAMVKVAAAVGGIRKSGVNKFDNYSYAKLEDYVKAAAPVLAEHGLMILTSVDSVESMPDRTTKNGGTEHCARVIVTMRLVHESGEWIESQSAGEGQDRADKAIYKAITGARKYGIASMLSLATTDDPEDDGDGNAASGGSGKQAQKSTPAPRPAAAPKPAPAPQAPAQPPEKDWKEGRTAAEIAEMDSIAIKAQTALVEIDAEKWRQAPMADVHRYLRHVCHKKTWDVSVGSYKLCLAGLQASKKPAPRPLANAGA